MNDWVGTGGTVQRNATTAPSALDCYLKEVALEERIEASEEIELGRQLALAKVVRGVTADNGGVITGLLNATAAQSLVANGIGVALGLATPLKLRQLAPTAPAGIQLKSLPQNKLLDELSTELNKDEREVRISLGVLSALINIMPRQLLTNSPIDGLPLRRLSETHTQLSVVEMYETQTVQEADKILKNAVCARERMVSANLRLVISIAKGYARNSCQLLDIIQAGNVGLIKAVDKFDYQRGFRFSTYATWWIRQAAIKTAVEELRVLRLPAYVEELVAKIQRVRHRFEQEHGRTPNADEVSAITKIQPGKIENLLNLAHGAEHLERPLNEDQSIALGDMIEDPNMRPNEEVEEAMTRQNLLKTLATLEPDEKKIVRLRFGIDELSPLTLEQTAQRVGFSKEKVRQVERRAIRKLQHSSRRNMLR